MKILPHLLVADSCPAFHCLTCLFEDMDDDQKPKRKKKDGVNAAARSTQVQQKKPKATAAKTKAKSKAKPSRSGASASSRKAKKTIKVHGKKESAKSSPNKSKKPKSKKGKKDKSATPHEPEEEVETPATEKYVGEVTRKRRKPVVGPEASMKAVALSDGLVGPRQKRSDESPGDTTQQSGEETPKPDVPGDTTEHVPACSPAISGVQDSQGTQWSFACKKMMPNSMHMFLYLNIHVICLCISFYFDIIICANDPKFRGILFKLYPIKFCSGPVAL